MGAIHSKDRQYQRPRGYRGKPSPSTVKMTRRSQDDMPELRITYHGSSRNSYQDTVPDLLGSPVPSSRRRSAQHTQSLSVMESVHISLEDDETPKEEVTLKMPPESRLMTRKSTSNLIKMMVNSNEGTSAPHNTPNIHALRKSPLKKKKSYDPRLLSENDKMLIYQSWLTMCNYAPGYVDSVLASAWMRAVKFSPTWIGDMLGLNRVEETDMESHQPKFANIIERVRKFIHMLIKEVYMTPELVRAQCQILGARHHMFFDHKVGIEVAYWDSFSVSLGEAIEQSLTQRFQEAENQSRRRSSSFLINSSNGRGLPPDANELYRTLFAWQKFNRIIIDEMRTGYLEAMANEKDKDAPSKRRQYQTKNQTRKSTDSNQTMLFVQAPLNRKWHSETRLEGQSNPERKSSALTQTKSDYEAKAPKTTPPTRKKSNSTRR